MMGYVKDIEAAAIENRNFRKVLYTAQNIQLVVMSLKPGEDIGMEEHQLDQFFRVEEGNGEAVLDDVHTSIHAGFAVLVPAGTRHNIINTGDASLKLYTLYAPPNHRDGIVHKTRADAKRDTETFDGKPTERRIAVTVSSRSESVPVMQRPRLSLPFAVSLAARS
ncbi:MAG: cupin domain-containing protein [Beijerinckiaceae bacterium]